MFTRNRMMMAAALLAAPVLCCFLAVGGFVQLGVATEQAELKEQQQVRERARQSQQEREAKLNRQLRETELEAKNLKSALDGERARLGRLGERLQAEEPGAEAARRRARQLAEEGRKWQQRAAELQERLQELRGKIASQCEDLPEAATVGAGQSTPAQIHPLLRQYQVRIDDARRRGEQCAGSRDQMQAELAELQTENKRLQKAFQQLQDKSPDAQPPRYRIETLYGGSTRRERRAVFADCRAEGVLLEPSGLRLGGHLSPEDQARFLAEVRKTAYVVFVVRPDGVGTFRKYRRVVFSENRVGARKIDFGVEPVGQGWVVEYPTAREAKP